MQLKLSKWTVVGCLGALLLVSVLAHRANPGPMPILVRQLMDNLHPPAFALLVTVLVALFRQLAGARHVYVLAIAAATIIGILSEASQVFSARDADLGDLRADLFGIMSGALLAFFLFGDQPVLSRRHRRVAGATAVFLLACAPLIDVAHAIGQQRSLLPQLATFSAGWEERLYEQSANSTLTRVVVPGLAGDAPQPVARLDLANGMHPGLLMYPYSDWSAYNAVNLEVASASAAALDITIRIDDAWHNQAHSDRFNRTYTVGPDWQTIRIPLEDIAIAPKGRRMDLENISSLIIFASHPENGASLYISHIALD